MHSSTSSFERPLPDIPWLLIFGPALFVFFAFAVFLEVRLAQLGYHSTVLDSPEIWAKERIRASRLGKQALILIGASRIQLGIDLDTLRNETGLEPVQLAVDGSSFVPILKGLADDPTIRGTVLVDYYPGAVEHALSNESSPATAFADAYKKHRSQDKLFSLAHAEQSLAEIPHENLISFADGATPLMSLLRRIIPNEKPGQYLITLPDRSRLADYKLVAMPEFYYRRTARHLGLEQSINPSASNAEYLLKEKISGLHPKYATAYIQGARYLKELVMAITARGGKVIFVAMPTSGMIREIDEKLYPRAGFLEVFEKESGASILISADDPALRSFVCPDGSHLDFRDRPRFTAALIHSLGIAHEAFIP